MEEREGGAAGLGIRSESVSEYVACTTDADAVEGFRIYL